MASICFGKWRNLMAADGAGFDEDLIDHLIINDFDHFQKMILIIFIIFTGGGGGVAKPFSGVGATWVLGDLTVPVYILKKSMIY